MYSILFFGLYLINAVYCDSPKNWAVLVAGSNGYYNYRHQADICHSYQILHSHGIPDENIVVMMYDDIAENKENPTKGTIINRPNGPDVYQGVLKDYVKTAVTPANFLNVLSGNAEALRGVGSGKVIKSGPNDNVFVYFADHGAPGLIAFPNNKVLKAAEFNKTLQSMFNNKQYGKMVIYIEACESGSMFDGLLPPNVNIYATTAANPDESSYACYWDQKRQTYLGDVYSVMWMEDSDREDLTKETAFMQFQIVKNETNTSHVMQYGNLTIGKAYPLSEFQGNATPTTIGEPSDYAAILADAVPSEDVRTSILKKKYEAETDPTKKAEILAELEQLLKQYRVATTLIKELPSVIYRSNPLRVRSILNTKLPLRNHECYSPILDHMTTSCLTFDNEYVLKNLYVIVNLCESGISSERITKAIDIVCTNQYNL